MNQLQTTALELRGATAADLAAAYEAVMARYEARKQAADKSHHEGTEIQRRKHE